MNPLSQFVVDSLIPEGREQGRAYQLNETSVSPIRIVGRDRRGQAIEETLCALAKSAKFVDLDGNICDVPLRTGRVMSHAPEAVMYEQIVSTDLIRQGQIPLEACPHTHDFRAIVGYAGPLVAPADPLVRIDERTREELAVSPRRCDGRPGAERVEDACPHMRVLVADRRELARRRTKEEDDKLQSMKPSDVAALVETLGKAFTDAVTSSKAAPAPEPAAVQPVVAAPTAPANNPTSAAARKAMRDGAGEKGGDQ